VTLFEDLGCRDVLVLLEVTCNAEKIRSVFLKKSFELLIWNCTRIRVVRLQKWLYNQNLFFQDGSLLLLAFSVVLEVVELIKGLNQILWSSLDKLLTQAAIHFCDKARALVLEDRIIFVLAHGGEELLGIVECGIFTQVWHILHVYLLGCVPQLPDRVQTPVLTFEIVAKIVSVSGFENLEKLTAIVLWIISWDTFFCSEL